MCGFTGFINATGGIDCDYAHNVLREMGNAIAHRGPDSDGYWYDHLSGIGLAHRRLAILDLSPAGAQPMTSVSGRYVVAFNGEIYNHLRLREQLRCDAKFVLPWRGHSDTETLLAGFDAWGIEGTLNRVIGMFSIALWDRELCTLTLARDRLGEKPLYYGWQGQGQTAVFLFGSELSALRQHPAFISDIDRNSLASFMRHNNIGGENSIYVDIKKLSPGCILTVSRTKPEPVIRTWWSAANAVVQGIRHPFQGSTAEAVNELENLLSRAVKQQMLSDVPLGAFLSGGVDSSTVVALMQKQSSRAIRTFSIGFHEEGYNEAEHASAVAKYLGTDHTELYVTPEQALAVIPKLPAIYSEPFADSSQIPTYLVSQLAKEHVTVALSGDGGDELFCGYARYKQTADLWGKLTRLPYSMKRLAAGAIRAVSPSAWNSVGDLASYKRMGDRLHKGAMLLDKRSFDDFYLAMVSHWSDPADIVLRAEEPMPTLNRAAPALSELGDIETMMAFDILSYLPDDILTKVDRAAMGVSLETRVPFLDHRVVEFAWTMPLNYKLQDGVTKWPLREVLYRHVPRDLIERPKMGFGVPIDQWLRGPLRDWAETLLSESRLRNEGFLNPVPIRLKWAEHLSGQRNWQYHLWDVLMFQAWLEHQRG